MDVKPATDAKITKKSAVVEKPAVEVKTPAYTKTVGATNDSPVQEVKKPEPVREAHAPHRTQRSKIGRIDGRLALIAACVVLFTIVIAVLLPAEKEGHEAKAPESKVTNLMDEAEKNYGNSAYWPYIYEANKNILGSPVNVPKTLKLTIPDLSEQGIYVNNPA